MKRFIFQTLPLATEMLESKPLEDRAAMGQRRQLAGARQLLDAGIGVVERRSLAGQAGNGER